MRFSPLVLAGALLLCPAVAAADEPPPPPIPYATSPMPMPMPMRPAPYIPRLRYKRHSLALMAGGITLTAIGVLSILGGITAIVEDSTNHGEGFLALLVGVPLLVHGGGCLGGGIPMWRIGDRTIPAGWAAAVPSITPGKTTSLRWTF